MRVVLQRVKNAAVSVGGKEIAGIGRGVLVLAGIGRNDSLADLQWMAKKIVELRIFDDAEGKLNLDLLEAGGQVLIVSQFTLYGDCRKGRRPSYSDAAPPSEAQRLFDDFIREVRRHAPDARSGQFQAMMDVSLTNWGPVTLVLESPSERIRSAPRALISGNPP
jgi:D-tyrosyl-tRNA(Tyr) deacylase